MHIIGNAKAEEHSYTSPAKIEDGKLTFFKCHNFKNTSTLTVSISAIFYSEIIGGTVLVKLHDMKTEKQKMIAGEMYDPLDKQLVDDRLQTRLLIKALNETSEVDIEERNRIVRELIPNAAPDLWLQPPFYCDYGYNINVAERVFFNFNCIVLDVAPVTIGSRTMFGPNVQVYTATHPLNYVERSSGREYAKAIRIGEDVWIGGSAVICPGVTIGNRSVIGAGSVVTKDIPDDVFAAGNPCKVIKHLSENE